MRLVYYYPTIVLYYCTVLYTKIISCKDILLRVRALQSQAQREIVLTGCLAVGSLRFLKKYEYGEKKNLEAGFHT